ncbi:hypothetical protein FACS1894124_0680 [Spirochaetia bacterium]|nr:hypothetical protein FACS1894124_0680 [Spirochaetia bacterium]
MARGFADNPQNINRAGRPKKGLAMTDLVIKALNEKRGDTPAKIQVVEKLIDLAIAGDPVCIKYLIDRTDGRPAQTLTADLSGAMTFDTAAAAEKLERMLLHDH